MLIDFLRVDIFGGELGEFTKENITEDNLTEIYNLAQKHDLAHVVADILFKTKLMPEVSISESYRAALLIALARYQRLSFELEKVCNLLEENGIPHMPLKGSVIRKYYTEPWLRTSGDIDILVKPEDLEKAGNLIINEFNYIKSGVSSHDWCLFTEDRIIVELHYSLIEQGNVQGRKRHKWYCQCLENIWDNLIWLRTSNINTL
ncbi:MAG: nucleotidyltransferase family protein [Clostridia bacterium]|nr:nucleotidyltransferase family protein [Clostridia bacterium]